MSGDVQPRKRKDKRKKRDERKSDGDVSVLRQPSFQDDEDSSSHGVHITKMGNDDVHLHVQQQHGTGGHWCAKIIFFSLMAVLLGLVGLIILENRGLEDLDTPLSESRYSNYFDGWVDEHRQEEHDAHHSPEAALDEHDDEHDEEPDEAYDQHSGEEEEDHEADEEEEEADEDENTGAENVTAEDDEEENDEDEDVDDETEASIEPTQSVADDADEDDEEAEDEEEDADDEIEESIEPPVSRSRAQSAPETVEEDDEDDIEEEEDEEDADEEELEESIEPTISQSQAQSAPDPADDENDDDDDEDATEEDEEPQESIEPAQQSAPVVDGDDDDEDFEQDDNDEDDFESLDQEVDNEAEERQRQAAAELKAKQAKQDQAQEDNAETVTTASWLGSQIKPKEPTGAKSVEDVLFEQELRQANAEMINENYAKGLRDFNTLTHTHAHKPAAHLHRARALERIAELRQSNQLLLDAIESYKRYLAFQELIASDSDYRAAGERCIRHLRFLGRTQQAVGIHEQLLARYPAEAQLRNELSLTHLMSNNLVKLQQVAAETLERWPRDPQAQLHFGLALKQLGGDFAGALPYLQRAIDSEAAGTQEPYFYLALGETLQRLGRQTQALQLYRRGADRGFFASVYQRSLYNVPGLRAKPFWQPAETGQADQLEQLQRNWRAIRAEALALLSGQGNFQLEAEQLRDTGNWQQYELYARGQRLERNCQRAPVTCALLDKFPAASSCRRGQIKFSAMQAQTHVWPHCGPTNCRLRAHLTLVAPEPQLTSLRVAEHQRTWHEGDLFIFDDSFEHEVWHNGTQLRLVLILDLWHPDLSAAQRRSLTPI
ncbi:aspartyl/asparaginyl beta-hydroxylase isoform X5 [Drosophila montana]|uniref:aspartyl/asparaginyl beta-hydroxylase isoform X5 n=1 Tax=Drosophila montana TaxID=40370 RepID=UPI00313D9F77